jgi:uncharacterized membrane protein YhaH (DUF805 family)
MTHLILASKGLPQVILIVVGLFLGVFVLAYIYSKITSTTKMDKDTKGCGWPIFLLIVALIIGALINMKGCKGCKGHGGSDYDPVEYQHLR